MTVVARKAEMDRHAVLLNELDGPHPPYGTYLTRVEAERYVGLSPPKFLRLVAQGVLVQWRRYGKHPNRVWYRRAECDAVRVATVEARRKRRDQAVPPQVVTLHLTASEDYLPALEAAAYCGLTLHALLQLATSGALTPVLIGDRHRYRRADLDALRAARETT